MSATGQGGVTVISGANHSALAPVLLPGSSELVFSHNLGRKAFSVIVTDGANFYGQILTSAEGIYVRQTDANSIRVINERSSRTVFVSCRWEEPTPELDLVRASDPRIEIIPIEN